MTFGSLFAGIGGFDLGFGRAGLTCLWQVEIDPQAAAVLATHWPDVPRHLDIRACGKGGLAPVDVLCGGFPCQDLSVAGKRAGLGAERSGLFYELARITDEIRPRLLVWENVPGLLSSDDGRDFSRVLRTLADIGYFGAWRVLDAQFFGVPQRRRRVFGVFAPGRAGVGHATQVLALSEGGDGHPAPGGETGSGVAGTLGSCSQSAGWRTDFERCGALIPLDMRQASRDGTMTNNRAEGKSSGGAPGTGIGQPGDPSPTIAETHVPAIAYQCHGSNVGPMGTVRKGSGGVTGGVPFIVNAAESCATKSHARESETARCLDQTGGFASNQGGTVIAHTLRDEGSDASEDGTGRGVPLAWTQRTRNGAANVEAQEDLAYALDAPKDGGRKKGGVIHNMLVRRLTPTECCRLQGFPDDWLDLTPPLSDSAKYRLLGNAVAVPVAEWIGRRILEASP